MFTGMLFAVIAGTGFSLLGILARLAYAQGLDVGQALLCRFLVGSVLLFVPMLLRPGLLRLDARGLLWAAFLGMGCYCGQSTFYFLTIRHLPVATASLLIYAALVGVALLDWASGRARPTATLWTSMALTLGGCGLVCADAFDRSLSLTGLGLAGVTTGCYTLYLFFSQTATRGRRPLTVSLYVVLFAAAGFLLLHGPQRLLEVPVQALPVAIGLGLIPTAIAISALFLAVERVGSAYASIGTAVEPAAALLFANIFLGEPVTWLQAAGAALILLGIAWPGIAPRATPMEATP